MIQNSRFFWVIITIFYYSEDWYNNIQIFCVVYLRVIYFSYAVGKRCTTFKYCLFVISICGYCCKYIAPAPKTVIVPLTSIYPSPKLQKHSFSIEVLNLIVLFLLYVPRASSFISTQLFILNLDGWFGVLSRTFIINIILYFYINLSYYINPLYYFLYYTFILISHHQ